MSFALYMLPAVGLLVPTDASARSYSNMSCSNLWYARNYIFADKGSALRVQGLSILLVGVVILLMAGSIVMKRAK